MLGLILLATLALAQSDDLRQRIDADQKVVDGRVVLAAGHVDVGPRFVDGKWTLMVHDDSARVTGGESVWRHAEASVLQVADEAKLRVPDDPAYAFLHSPPGTPVYVVPQTQDPDVVWVGWNTQDPEAMERIDRGATMTLTGVQGPGSLVVYLQSGSFDEPDVLWDSTGDPEPVWVDVNTHTHANWVFSEPGIYLVRVKIDADLVDGTTVSDTRELRFAVGSETSTEDAFAAAWRGAASTASATATPDAADASGGGGTGRLIAVAALALAGGLALVVVRGDRAKRRARTGAGGR